ncbi:hypothetical protein CK203_028175 [Vitis vinifera]|uniref:Uncharacterized protein n=1 Tax=Vitis vinifera TaxID=29760 RepID=A0A438IAX2_VITVI|nr:hypothetical protein CK203_028175 [Vitis vinifera]
MHYYAKYFPPAYKDMPSHGFIAYLPTLLAISGTCPKAFVDNTYTPFFESLAKKPPTTMDDLFRRANKYSMLEDDVRAATQQVLVAGRPSRSNTERNAKPPDRQSRLTEGRKGQGLSDFRWPRPIGTDPSTRDRSRRCAFHKDHGHTTETCRAFHFLVERLIKAGHLKQYLRSDNGGRDTSQHHNPGSPRAPTAPRPL